MAAGVTVFHQVGFRKIGDDLIGDGEDVANTEMQVSLKERTLILNFPKVDNFQVEVSEDVFKTYKAGPLSVLVKYPLGNLLVRLASAEDSSRLWSLIENVSPHKKKQNAFDKRTTDSSAQQYFQFYGYISQQQNMLQDHVRTTTYQSAFFQNYMDFAGKVVLDVGAGTGILSFFAAQAGAAKVYAVEASNMATHCQELVRTNKMESIITVVSGKIEEIDLPEMVDTIISEPMGYLLFNERMLESFVHARKWLKPGGKMFPSQGDLYISPFVDDALFLEQSSKSHFWFQQSFHGVNLSCLRGQAYDEYFHQPVVDTFDLRVLMAKPVRYMVDFLTTKESDLENIVIPLQYQVTTVGTIHGLAFWFDVAFVGSLFTVWLSTAPSQPLTHWYQVRCLLRQPLHVTPGVMVMGTVVLKANERQSYDIDLQLTNTQTGETSSNCVDLKNPYFRYTGVAPQPPPGSTTESPTQKILAQQAQVDRDPAAMYQSFPTSAAAAHVSEDAAMLSTASGYAPSSGTLPLATPSAIPSSVPGGVVDHQATMVPMVMQGPANQFTPAQYVPRSK